MYQKKKRNCYDEDPFYQEPRWRRLRQSVLRRDKYMDVEAKRYGKVKEAEIVHHIFPKNEYPEYAYELWNLISVSRETHNKFHDRDTDELTEAGMDLLRRTCRKQNMPVPEKYMQKKQKGKSKSDKSVGVQRYYRQG